MDKRHLQVRRQLEQAIGEGVPPKVWQRLVARRWVEEVLNSISTIDELAAEAKDLIQLSRTPFDTSGDALSGSHTTSRRQRRHKIVQARQLALSHFLADAARHDRALQAFREKNLPEGPLRIEEIERWIREQLAAEPRTMKVIIRLPPEVDIRHDGRQWRTEPPLQAIDCIEIEDVRRGELLEYIREGSNSTAEVEVPFQGPLKDLHRLSERLARTFGWSIAKSTTFILTDRVPMVSLFTPKFTPRAPYRSRTQIELIIDPILTPREVYQLYCDYRARLIHKVPRSISEKHSSLAIFALSHPQLSRHDFVTWNRDFPKSSYAHFNRFRSDGRTAERRYRELITRTVVDHSKVLTAMKKK